MLQALSSRIAILRIPNSAHGHFTLVTHTRSPKLENTMMARTHFILKFVEIIQTAFSMSLSSRCSLFNIALRARLRDGVAIIVFSSFGIRVRVTRVKCPWAEFGILKIATQLESACNTKFNQISGSCTLLPTFFFMGSSYVHVVACKLVYYRAIPSY